MLCLYVYVGIGGLEDVTGGYNGRGASGLNEGVGCHCQGGMWRSQPRFGRRTSRRAEGHVEAKLELETQHSSFGFQVPASNISVKWAGFVHGHTRISRSVLLCSLC